MSKRRFIYILLSLITGYMAYLAYTFFLSPNANLQPVYLIPKDAVFIVETQEPVENWDKIRESELWQHLQQNDYFADLTSSIRKMDTLFHKKKKLFKLFGTRSLVFSIHMYRPKDYGIFYVIDLKKIAKLQLLKSYFNTLLDDDYVLSKRSYNGHEIIELYDKTSKETLYLSFIQNQLIASYVHSLVEASIDQYQKPAIGRDFNFIEVHKHTGYDDMFRLYVQYAYLDDYVRYFSDEKNTWAQVLSKTLGFSGFNLDLKSNNTVIANGYTNLDEKGTGYLQALQQSGIAPHKAARIIPRNNAIYLSFGFDSFNELYGNFEKLLERDSEADFKAYQAGMDRVEKLLKIDVKEHFMSWIGDEIAFIQLKPDAEIHKNELALLIKTKDTDLAGKNLGIITEQVRKRTPVKFKQFNYKGYPVNFLSIKDFFAVFFGGAFNRFEKPYFTIIEDYVIFSNEPGTLKTIIDNYVAGNTLETSEDYTGFNRQFKKESSVFAYINMPALFRSVYLLADEKTRQQMTANEDFIICFPQFGFQLTPDDQLFKSRIVVNYQDPKVVRSKAHFNLDTLYGPSQKDATKPAASLVSGKDVFDVEAIFPDDLNAREYTSTYTDGTLHIRMDLKNGQKHGRYFEYYKSGAVKVKGRFKKDEQTGTWRYYDPEGNLLRKKQF